MADERGIFKIKIVESDSPVFKIKNKDQYLSIVREDEKYFRKKGLTSINTYGSVSPQDEDLQSNLKSVYKKNKLMEKLILNKYKRNIHYIDKNLEKKLVNIDQHHSEQNDIILGKVRRRGSVYI